MSYLIICRCSFILILSLVFPTSSWSRAFKKDGQSSLIIGLNHARSLLPHSSSALQGLEHLEALEMMQEPLRGFRDGYLISLNLGNPPQVIQAYMDTGSDLAWVPCAGNISFDCIDCDDYRNYKLVAASYSPSLSCSSTRDLCTSPMCTEVHSSDNFFDPCTVAGCSISTLLERSCPRPCPSFSYTYGSGGLVIGSLTRDTLRVHRSSSATVELQGFSFGCVGSTFREPIGIAGFGKGPLSFPSQLGLLHKGFSYCFLGFKYSNNPNMSSPLLIGELALSSKGYLQFTTMLKSPMYPSYYYIGLQGIGVGNETMVEAPSSLRTFDFYGNGGMLIDSGTTYTHLPEPFYTQLLSEISSKLMYTRSKEYEQRTVFDLCYEVPLDGQLPSITFYFLDGVKLSLPKESCFYAMSPPKGAIVIKCFLFQAMDDGDYGPAGVFGSFQQQNVEVAYDLQIERIGFQTTDCASYAASYGLHHK